MAKIAELYAEFTVKGLRAVQMKLKGFHASLSGANENLQAVSRTAKRVFIAIGGFMAVAVRQAVRFESEMANVSTMLSDNVGPTMARFERQVRALAVEFGESTRTLSKGLYDVLSASIAPEKAMNVLAVAAKAAAAGMTSTAVSTDAITTILNAYQMDAERAAEVSDKLWATVKRGKITFEELGSSIGKVAAVAAVSGLSLEELLASISTITRVGIKSDQAMTAVVGTLRTFLSPTEEAVEAADQYGIALNTATLRAEGLSGVFERLNGLTAEQLGQIFPNVRGLKGVAAAMQDLTGLSKDLALQTNSTGLTQQAFAKIQRTVGFQLKQVKAGFNEAAISIGQALMPQVKGLVKFLGNLASAIRNNSGAVLAFLETAAAWALRIMAVAAAVKVLSVALTLLTMNPIGAFVAIIGIAIIATRDWEGAIEELGSKIAEMTEKAIEMSHANRQAADSTRIENAAIREKMERLRELTEKQERSVEEEMELVRLQTSLTNSLPNLASAIDGVVNAALSWAAAMEEVNKQLLLNEKKTIQISIKKTAKAIGDAEEAVREEKKKALAEIHKFTMGMETYSDPAMQLRAQEIRIAAREQREVRMKEKKDRLKSLREELENQKRILEANRKQMKLLTSRKLAGKTPEEVAEAERLASDLKLKSDQAKLKAQHELDAALFKSDEERRLKEQEATEKQAREAEETARRYSEKVVKEKERIDKAAVAKAEREAKENSRRLGRSMISDMKDQVSALEELRRGTIAGMPDAARRKAETDAWVQAMKNRLGPKLFDQFKDQINAEAQKRMAGPGMGAGRFEGFQDLFRRLQSVAMSPELKEAKKANKNLEAIKKEAEKLNKNIVNAGRMVA